MNHYLTNNVEVSIKLFKQKVGIYNDFIYYYQKFLEQNSNNVDQAVNIYKQNVKKFVELTGTTEQIANEKLSRELDLNKAVQKYLEYDISYKSKKIEAQTSKSEQLEQTIKAFMGYTDTTREIAKDYINNANNDINSALQMYKIDLKTKQTQNLRIQNVQKSANTENYENQLYINKQDLIIKEGCVNKEAEQQNQHQSTPPPQLERQISPNKQNPVIRPPTPKTGFFGPKKEDEIASFQEKYLCEPKNANKVQTVSFAVRNGQQLVQFIQKQNPKLIINDKIDQLNDIQQQVQIQVNEAEKLTLNQIVKQYLIGQFQNTAQGNGTDAQNQQKMQQQGYQQNVANAQQLQVQPQQQQTFVNFQSQLPNQFNQYSYNQFTKYQKQGPLQANVAMAPVQQFNQNQNANAVLQARPMTPQGQNPIMQQQVPQYAENQGQSIQQRPVSRGQPNYALENQQYVQNQPQVNAVFNQERPLSPANQQFAQNPVLQNNVNRPMTPQSQANQLLYQQQVQNYQQQNYNQFQQQNPAAFPQNRPQSPSFYANQQNKIAQAQYQQQAQFQPQYQQNNVQTSQQQQTQNQVPQQITNSNQMNQNQIPANMDLQQQIVQYAQMQTAPFQQSVEQQKVIQQALFQQQFQNSGEVPVLQLSGKNE
ncbi:Hypothetical_protein [Hexamita inflata]|uniref:Hypothetical_protein n=1 Tax=Hexamita inflata TaxID=28002 RepID=A0AA86U8D7_9EUKA|nr:Hypothetical protein HINF_LOCUS32864 [Hexamita inflata]